MRFSFDPLRLVILAVALAWVLVASILSAFVECTCSKSSTSVNGQSLSAKKDENDGLRGAAAFFATSALPVTIILVGLAAFLTTTQPQEQQL